MLDFYRLGIGSIPKPPVLPTPLDMSIPTESISGSCLVAHLVRLSGKCLAATKSLGRDLAFNITAAVCVVFTVRWATRVGFSLP